MPIRQPEPSTKKGHFRLRFVERHALLSQVCGVSHQLESPALRLPVDMVCFVPHPSNLQSELEAIWRVRLKSTGTETTPGQPPVSGRMIQSPHGDVSKDICAQFDTVVATVGING